MTALTRLQDDFQDFLTGRGTAIVAQVLDGPRAPAPALMAIYAEAYRARLLEVLEKDFPGLRALAGHTAFRSLAAAYLEAFPPDHFSIRWAGRRLPAFLARRGQAEAAEMAAFEWALGEAFDAADAQPLPSAVLASLPPASWPDLRFALHPSLRRLDLFWPMPEFRRAALGKRKRPAIAARESPQAWAIWRHQPSLRVRYRRLAADEAAALNALGAGEPFSVLCDGLDSPLRAASLLRGWLADGLLTGIRPVAPGRLAGPRG